MDNDSYYGNQTKRNARLYLKPFLFQHTRLWFL